MSIKKSFALEVPRITANVEEINELNRKTVKVN